MKMGFLLVCVPVSLSQWEIPEHKRDRRRVMNRSLLWMLVAVMMIVVTPAFAGVAIQMWKCEMGDGATEEQVMDAARKWLEKT